MEAAKELELEFDDDTDGRCRHCDRWCGKRICNRCWGLYYVAGPDANTGASCLYERI